jgi:DNA (cytosine-5)-methyltransferase 1
MILPSRRTMKAPRKTKSKGRKPLQVTAVDLFCGAGGLTRGLLDAGISVKAGFDIDPACKHPYEANNDGAKLYLKSVAELSADELSKHYPNGHVRVLAGCAPCQPFSKYTQGKNTEVDEKWGLLHEFSRLVRELGPEVVSMENVPEVQRHTVFLDFVSTLEALDYKVNFVEAYCPDYGVPQQRKRLVLLASRLGPIELIKPSKPFKELTVRSAIGHLPQLAAGGTSNDPLHRACKLSPLNLKRIKASRPGGNWRDWPKSLVAECHRSLQGQTYPSVYGRMEWDQPSPTMTTQFFGYGNGRFGHPEQHRAITLREGAILQSFPPDYEFVGQDEPVHYATLGRLIGNAVPVRLGEAVGRSIIAHVNIAQPIEE